MTEMFAAVQATTAGDIINAYLSGGFLVDFVTVIIANLVLSGDNAVVIALAARSLPPRQRLRGIVFGTIAAILMRVILTYFAAMLLNVPYMKLIGGLLILGIAVKLVLDKDSEHQEKETSGGFLRVIGVILLADLIMSVDNVLAVAGASKGNPALLFLGLGLSIPIVAFGSSIISRLMVRFPVIIYVGAGILGKVAAEMILTDPLTTRIIHSPGNLTRYAVEILLACAVIGTGMLWVRMREAKSRPAITGSNPFYVTGWDIR
ncbi:MAG: TerC family protein [Syntrophorhabdaceae bacterium]